MIIKHATYLFLLSGLVQACSGSDMERRGGKRNSKDGDDKKGSGPQCGTGSGGVSLDGKFSYHIVHGAAVPPLTDNFGGGVKPIASSGYFTFNEDGPCTCSIYGVRNFNGNNFGGEVIFSTDCTYGFDSFGSGLLTATFADTGTSDFALSVVSEEEFSFMRQDSAILVGLCKKTYLEA